MLGINRSTLTRWVKRGTIKTFRRGAGKTNEILFHRADVETHVTPTSR
jgi:excisionase family DNA binding protein